MSKDRFQSFEMFSLHILLVPLYGTRVKVKYIAFRFIQKLYSPDCSLTPFLRIHYAPQRHRQYLPPVDRILENRKLFCRKLFLTVHIFVHTIEP
jgi:hypothetical protein